MKYDILATAWADPFRLETKVQRIIAEQARHGWLFDISLALEIRAELSAQKQAIDEELYAALNWRRDRREDATILKPFVASGDLSVRVKKWMGEAESTVRGPFSKVYWEPMNLDSVAQVKEFLLTIGWEPDEWNTNDDGEKTSPKLTESSLEKIDHPLGRHIAQREVISHRIGFIDSLLKNVRDDNRVPSVINTLGAATHRATHRIIVNTPKAKAKVFYGIQLRSMFTIPNGYKLLGIDAKGLQARCLAHYVNDPEFTKATISGDLHTDNLEALGDLCPDRDVAKNVLYCLLFGGGDPKMARTAEHTGTEKQLAAIGAEMRARLLGRWGAFEELTKGVKAAATRGYLYGIDGRKIWLRGSHMALNTLLQSMEAIIMKAAMCYLNDWRDQYRLDAHQLTWQHDEFQWEVLDGSSVDCLREGAMLCVPQAGEFFGSNCPLESDVKVGKTWADCH